MLFKGSGIGLQIYESEIAERILKVLTREGICCLSVHDSFIVQEQYRDRLYDVMTDSFKKVMGVTYDPVIT